MKSLLIRIRNSFSSPKGWVFLDQAVFSGTSFLTTILLARQLGASFFGMYSLIIVYLYLLLSISSAIIAGPFQVLFASNREPAKYLMILTILQFALCLLFAGITFFITSFPKNFLHLHKENIIAVCILLSGFLFQDLFRRVFLATGHARNALIIDVISGGLQLMGLCWYFFSGHLTLTHALYIIGLTYIPSITYAFCIASFQAVTIKEFRNCLHLHIKNGKWLLATSVLQWWSNNFLMATAGFFVGLAAIGALRLAQTLCGVLNAVLQVLENYSLPRASVILSAENMQQFRDYLFTTGKQTILLAVPFLFTLIAFPRQVMLFAGGAEFIAYTYVLQGMALVYTIILVGYPIRLAIRALLMNREFFIAYAASGIFSLLAVKTIIAQWHLAGVLVALTVNQLLVLFYWTWVLKRKNIVIWKSFM